MRARSWSVSLVLGMIVSGAAVAPAAQPTVPPSVAQLIPNDSPVMADCPVPPPGCAPDVISELRIASGGGDEWTTIEVEILEGGTGGTWWNYWYWCPAGTSVSPSAVAAKCTFKGQARATAPGGSVLAPFATDAGVGRRWDARRWDVLAVACSGRGRDFEGTDANCTTDVQRDIYLDDAREGSVRNQTSAGAVAEFRTFADCVGSTASECDAEFEDLPLGSDVPDDGFDFRAVTSREVAGLQWVLNGPIDTDHEPSGANFAGSGDCSFERLVTQGKTWLCFLTADDVPDGIALALSIMKANAPGTERQGSGGYCNSNNNPKTDQDPKVKGVQRAAPRNRIHGAHDYCVLDSHYVVSAPSEE